MLHKQLQLETVDSSSGTVYIDNELISFTGTDEATNSLTGCTRAATLTNFQAGAARSYTAGVGAAHDARTGVILISNTCTPSISHLSQRLLQTADLMKIVDIFSVTLNKHLQ